MAREVNDAQAESLHLPLLVESVRGDSDVRALVEAPPYVRRYGDVIAIAE
jgi:hypothetical protein